MPMYEFRCESCLAEVEDICSYEQSQSYACECGTIMTRVFTGRVAFLGAMPSRPISHFHKQIGRSFETNAEERQFWKEHKGWVPMDKSDRLMVDRRDFHKNASDARARKQGYNDAEHRRRELKKTKAKEAK